MGHLHTDITIKGSKTESRLEKVSIDTGATYTVLPENILKEVGAWGPLAEVEVELGDGQKVKVRAYAIAIRIKEVEAPSITVAFAGAKTVVGVETLESVGLKLDPTTGNLEFSRPKGTAYFY